MKDGFVKIACITPEAKIADAEYNARICAELASEAASSGCAVAVFPRLALSMSTAESLFYSSELLSASESGLAYFIEKTKDYSMISFIGLPISYLDGVYDAVAAVSGGRLLAVIARASQGFATLARERKITLAGQSVYLVRDALFAARNMPELRIACDSGEGFIPRGATLTVRPSSEIRTHGSEARLKKRMSALASEYTTAYAYASSGESESGNDALYSSLKLITEPDGEVASSRTGQITYGVVDLGKLQYMRRGMNSGGCRVISFDTEIVLAEPNPPEQFPFIPKDSTELSEVIDIQARALSLRMKRARARTLVLGVSGGLDSTMAMVVAARAVDILGEPRNSVIAVTMPCFGTTGRTRGNAESLSELLSTELRTIDIKSAVSAHLSDISHREGSYDVVYENAQARERTQILMDIANAEGGIVVGTGDLSELALGFATYNGDHMSMYGVNATVPKTLMRAVLKDYAEHVGGELGEVILDVIGTPVSPELLPTDSGQTTQKTEEIVGSYELHDFLIYNMARNGMSPRKLLRVARLAFSDRYSDEYIEWVLKTFIRRFFSSQFKRSCLPDGPQVTEVSFSPRGAWNMPSDMSADSWLNSIKDGE